MEKNSPSLLAFLLLALLSIIWGSSFLLMKVGLDAFSPLEIATIRLSIAGIVLLPVVFARIAQLNIKQVLLLALIGLTGNGIPAFLFPMAEQVLPTAVAGVLNAMTPIFTIILAALFFKARFPLIQVVGITIGLVGTILLATANKEGVDLSQNIQYSLLIVAATICYAISVNLTKEHFSETSPFLITGVALASLAIPSLIYLFIQGDFITRMNTHPEAWTSFGAIAILGALGTALAVALFYKMLQMSSIIFATSVTYTIPIVAVLIGVFYLDESLDWRHYLGFSVILGGVYLVNRKR